MSKLRLALRTDILQKETQPDRPTGALEVLRKIIPFEAGATSDHLGWVGLEAARYHAAPAAELNPPAITHDRLVLFIRPPHDLDLTYEGVQRRVPPPAGSISVVPAGSPVKWRWSGCFDWLHIWLSPELIARVAAQAFDLDPARMTIPPLDSLEIPQLQAAMWGVDAELTAGGPGGRLAAESLANLLAVCLIRHILAPGRAPRPRDGTLPLARLRAVVDYIEAHLSASPTLERMAAVAGLSTYHFARQFKTATGLPPYQYVIARRVDLAKQFLQHGGDLSLAEVATRAGFSDQSQLSRHFKRLVGVTPGAFQTPARIA
jgi:AraC family transcriptional regulator